MTIFSPDGRYGYVCSSFSPETVAIDVKSREIVGGSSRRARSARHRGDARWQAVWFTLKDVGRVQVFEATPPFKALKTIETGPITNHVNIARTKAGQFAYVTIGGLNHVKVFRTDDFSQVATIPPARSPRSLALGRWNADLCRPGERRCSRGDRHGPQRGHRHDPDRPGPQGVAYVPEAVPEGAGAPNLQPLGAAGQSSTLTLAGSDGKAATQVTLFDQGVLQTLQAAVTGLTPKKPYVLALSADPKGAGPLEPLAAFMTNPAGAAIVNAIGRSGRSRRTRTRPRGAASSSSRASPARPARQSRRRRSSDGWGRSSGRPPVARLSTCR